MYAFICRSFSSQIPLESVDFFFVHIFLILPDANFPVLVQVRVQTVRAEAVVVDDRRGLKGKECRKDFQANLLK